MPLTALQCQVLRIIGKNRSPESHVAGGIALNSQEESARFSEDIDIFHEAEEQLDRAFRADLQALGEAGMETILLMDGKSYRRAEVRSGGEHVVLDWAIDSCFRFFPIIEDQLLTWKLHPFDAVTNKALALGSRSETRDLVDIVIANATYPLHTIVWAACAKDPGYTPLSLLEMMRRFARVDANALDEMNSTISATELKTRWLAMASEAESKVVAAAKARIEPGVLFLSSDGNPCWWDQDGAFVHHATLGGVWPKVVVRHKEGPSPRL